jgi:hypothetical protein
VSSGYDGVPLINVGRAFTMFVSSRSFVIESGTRAGTKPIAALLPTMASALNRNSPSGKAMKALVHSPGQIQPWPGFLWSQYGPLALDRFKLGA